MQATDSHSVEHATSGLGPYADTRGRAHDRSAVRGCGDGMPQRGSEHFITEWATQHAEARGPAATLT